MKGDIYCNDGVAVNLQPGAVKDNSTQGRSTRGGGGGGGGGELRFGFVKKLTLANIR